MPHRIVLSQSQRELFSALPTEPAELAKYYTFSDADLVMIRKRRESKNRIGFAVQLCLMRYPGRRLQANEQLPDKMIAFIAEQLAIHPIAFSGYALREETRREHFLLLAKQLQVESFGTAHYRNMTRWLIPIAVENPNSDFLVGALLNELRIRRILHPVIPVIERMVAAAKRNADRRIFNLIYKQLQFQHRVGLDEWLNTDTKQQSRLSWIRQPVGRPCPANILVILEKLDAIKALSLPGSIVKHLPVSRKEQLAREGSRIAAHNLRMISDAPRRFSILTVYLLEHSRALVDEAITMHDRIVGGLIKKSKRKYSEQLQKDTRLIKQAINTLATLGEVLVESRQKENDVWGAIDQAFSWAELQARFKEAEDLASPCKLNPLRFADNQYPQMRRYTPELLEHFDFQAAKGGQEVLDAITLLRDMNRSGKRKLPDDAPMSFITAQWYSLVFQDNEPDKHFYELCALSELRNHLRSGDIYVAGSRQYQDFDGYLISKDTYGEMKRKGDLPVAVVTDFSRYMSERTSLLKSELDKVDSLVRQGKLDDVTIKNNSFHVKPHKAVDVPEEAKALIREIYQAMPKIKITDLLVEVDDITHFTDQFTHLRTGLPAEDKQSLLAVILSDAINLGLTRMAQASRGATFKQLSWTSDWYVRDDSYSRALAELINFHHDTDLVNSWGDGSTSSSDGQNFPVGHVARRMGDVNPKYGSHSGVNVYTHISDQYSPFYTGLIHSTMRDATYVLDGLLYHGCNLNIKEHYTDTAGFTDHVFGLCHLLGFRFAPRIRDIGDLVLYPPDKADNWPHLKTILGERIKPRKVDKQWDEILRLTSSIRLGTVTASLITRKLASYPRQNKLALALREFGRIERTLFILEWMQKPELRARVQAGLNKGEARNNLARAVFFNRLGEIRDKSFENQSYRVSGLNLVVAAIILWNTIHLEEAIAEVKKRKAIPDKYLSYLSPLGWDHISLTGDYIWILKS
ncbi:Tn3 family transposase [Endozoicomonas euniceicola]|uniref:Tn3 family transposase n=1 Tax=Endozoicomonas euniceicola TaxID=1234143 RepID=A0ABY6GT83_9GAMM|nr:Tn3 family transposase [Endozoicomonas euniceicola]UYM15959.1 Tn3 family transposase [Endozoicomonas euniceicola]